MANQSETLVVSEARWREAQVFELNCWIEHNRRNSYARVARKFAKALGRPGLLWNYLRHGDFHCGDDWNYWWRGAFEKYKSLPLNFDKAIEVGCGPYTNIRLIAKGRRIAQIHCADPLIGKYLQFRHTWLTSALRNKRVIACECKGESLPYNDSEFGLAVCINVLDHVEDAMKCMSELVRVTKPGGWIVFGQDLTNAEDLANEQVRGDVGHPIRVTDTTIDAALTGCKEVFRKVLNRQEGRAPEAHYATYLFIGQKR
jgi:ubiquinone/menaquinone biosynthesis C-methylase UbiE